MPDTELFRDELLIQLQKNFSDEEIENYQQKLCS